MSKASKVTYFTRMYFPDGTTKRPFSTATATHIGLNPRPMYGGKLRHQRPVI